VTTGGTSTGAATTGAAPSEGGADGSAGSARGGSPGGAGGEPIGSGGRHTGGSGETAGAPNSSGNDAGGSPGAAGGESEPGGAAGRTGAGGAGGDPVPELNGCLAYVDRTTPNADRTIVWDTSVAFAPERCMKIRVHQRVVFEGDFDSHPIEACGGDTPNPFSSTPQLFSETGVFGYVCSIHAEMTGAIWVVH